VGIAVSGIAGPGGGSDQKPVGTVWLAVASAQGVTTRLRRLAGTREQVKTQSAWHALDLVRRHAAGLPCPEGEKG
jgi:nicotinamide-nucleotide amidase